MALVDLLLKLEDLTHRRIPPGKVQPKDMDTVALMFATAERVGEAAEVARRGCNREAAQYMVRVKPENHAAITISVASDAGKDPSLSTAETGPQGKLIHA